MNLQELMEKIKLPDKAREVAMNCILPETLYQERKELFNRDMKQFLEMWKESDNHMQWILAFYLQLALEVYGEYKEQGISEEIFIDTFYDITIWCEECKRKYGIYGLKEVWWIAFSVKMKIFRLGRLQFEPMVITEELRGERATLKSGTKVLNVHIPSGEKLDAKEYKKSFDRAEEFFGDTYEAYICDSWLLDPALKELLPSKSNIVQFQNLFEIVKTDNTFPQGEERVFLDVREDKENYPENTLLQKKVKEYILNGNDLKIGIEFFYK